MAEQDVDALDRACDCVITLMSIGRLFGAIGFAIAGGRQVKLSTLPELCRSLNLVASNWENVPMQKALDITIEGQSILRSLGLTDETPSDDNDNPKARMNAVEELEGEVDNPNQDGETGRSTDAAGNQNTGGEGTMSKALTEEEAERIWIRIDALQILINKMVYGPIRLA